MRTALLTVLALAPAALAMHTPQGLCTGRGGLGVMEFGATLDRPVGPVVVYVDDRGVAPRLRDPLLGNGIWLYLESNGIYHEGNTWHSLQRGGASPFVPDDRDTCTDDPGVTPDILIL